MQLPQSLRPRAANAPAKRRSRAPRLALALVITSTLAACGGGGGDGGGASTPASITPRLCPASVDYSTPYIGGTGSGELVKVQIDTAKRTWAVTFLDSSVPRTTGTVSPTRSIPPTART